MSAQPVRLTGAVIVALVGMALVPQPAKAAAGGLRAEEQCQTSATSFRPKVARFSPMRKKTFDVVRVARTKSGAIGAPPLTKRGKHLVGWDPHTKPASGTGSVILDAHTWPGGGALGNTLLRKLRRGDVITLSAGKKQACYRVTKRRSYPVKRFPHRKAFRSWGAEQVVIVVCSGKRLGPGNWTHRTVWYATPLTAGEG